MRILIEKDGKIIWATAQINKSGYGISDVNYAHDGTFKEIINALEDAIVIAKDQKQHFEGLDPDKQIEAKPFEVTFPSE